MRNLHIPGTATTPEVNLDLMDVCFSITGRSVPSNAHAFYAPVLRWLDDHVHLMPVGSVVTIDLEYFNTSSMKALYQVLERLGRRLQHRRDIRIVWMTEAEDDQVLDVCAYLVEQLGIPMEILERPQDDQAMAG